MSPQHGFSECGILAVDERTHDLLLLAERIALTHHERWDGTGYPDQLHDDEIPLAGRIAAIADVFDALTHQRPYKHARPVALAVREIIGQQGRQFDPYLVDAFAQLDHNALLSRVQNGDRALGGSHPHSEVRLAGLA